MNQLDVKQRIEDILRKYARASNQKEFDSIIPGSLTSGKLYEAHVLSKVVELLHTREQLQVVLKNGNYIALKSSPGPINRKYPYFQLYRDGIGVAEIWTDIEFTSLSYSRGQNAGPPKRGDYHELDVLVVDPHIVGRPAHSQIWLGVECKNTGYGKNLLREILGVRRELSFVSDDQNTRFSNWPRSSVPADPASCLMVYSTDKAVYDYFGPGRIFGVDFIHSPI